MIKRLKEEKNSLRSRFSGLRKQALFKNEKDVINQVKMVLEKDYLTKNKNEYIGIYWPIGGEIDLRSLKKSSKYKLALPAVTNNKCITYHPWLDKKLGKDSLKITAPIRERNLEPKDISLLLVPALAIDINGYRLGYGGGYFDRLRSEKIWREIPSYVVLPQICVSNKPLPIEDWDIPFDGWISEIGLHQTQSINL